MEQVLPARLISGVFEYRQEERRCSQIPEYIFLKNRGRHFERTANQADRSSCPNPRE